MMYETTTQADITLDITEVGNKEDRDALLASVSEVFRAPTNLVDFWSEFPERTDRIPERMLVIADLGKIVKRYQSRDYHEWLASVRRAQPYFLALVRTKRDQRYADLVDDLMRHSDLRITVCRDRKTSAFLKCLWQAVSALDPNAIVDVRYTPSADRLWIAFSDGLSGFLDWESLGLTEILNQLRLDSATVGSDGATVEILTQDGETFEIDGLSIRALLDVNLAKTISERANESDREVGERIRSARLAQGMTQADLGKRTDIDQAIISKLERGKHQPRFDTVQRLAQGLGWTVSELLSEDPSVPTE